MAQPSSSTEYRRIGPIAQAYGPDDQLRGYVLNGVVLLGADGQPISGGGAYTGPLAAQLPASLGIKTAANSLSVAPASDSTYVVAGNVANDAPATANPLLNGGRASLAIPTAVSADGDAVRAWYSLNGAAGAFIVDLTSGSAAQVSTANAASRGSSNSVSVLLARTYPMEYNGSSWDQRTKANATSRIPSAANTTNATSAKASAGEVHQITAYNTTAAVKYLKLYNKASAPTVGTDTPTHTLPIPPNGSLAVSFPNGGAYFGTGIAYALTGAAADSDTTALTAGDVVGLTISYS
jgi:hypothetical protein